MSNGDLTLSTNGDLTLSIGYFHRGKPAGAKIIGVRTDFRNAGESPNAVVNSMIECACDRIVRSREELLQTFFELFEPER